MLFITLILPLEACTPDDQTTKNPKAKAERDKYQHTTMLTAMIDQEIVLVIAMKMIVLQDEVAVKEGCKNTHFIKINAAQLKWLYYGTLSRESKY